MHFRFEEATGACEVTYVIQIVMLAVYTLELFGVSLRVNCIVGHCFTPVFILLPGTFHLLAAAVLFR